MFQKLMYLTNKETPTILLFLFLSYKKYTKLLTFSSPLNSKTHFYHSSKLYHPHATVNEITLLSAMGILTKT